MWGASPQRVHAEVRAAHIVPQREPSAALAVSYPRITCVNTVSRVGTAASGGKRRDAAASVERAEDVCDRGGDSGAWIHAEVKAGRAPGERFHGGRAPRREAGTGPVEIQRGGEPDVIVHLERQPVHGHEPLGGLARREPGHAARREV